MTSRTPRQPTPEQLQALLDERLRRHPAASPEPLSDAELSRLMQRLHARRAEASAPLPVSPAPRPVAPTGLRQRLAATRRRWAAGALARPAAWATPLAAALGVLLVVVWPRAPQPEQPPSDWQSKGGMAWPAPDPASGTAGEQWLPSAQAAQDAHALAAALRAAGATVQVSGSGPTRTLQAQVPAAAQGAVAQVLADWGLAPGTGGAVLIRLSPLAP